MVKLEFFSKADFAELIEWVEDDEIMMNWAGSLFNFPLTEKSLDWYLTEVNDIGKSDAFIFKVVHAETGESIGHISLGSISKKNRSARISRVLIGAKNARGRGYCRHMIRQVLKFGFEELKLHKISLGVYSQNKAAIYCYENSGLVIEGVMRDTLYFKDEWWSLVEMSMLEEEYKARYLNEHS